MTDEEAMLAAAQGEDGAFAVLVDRHRNRLLNFFLRQNVSYGDGQDLAQRTFLRLWRYRKKYSPKARFTTFLFVLARQESIDFFRAESNRRTLREGYARELEMRAPEAPAPSGAERVDDRMREQLLALPPGMRDVVELAVMQDLPNAEVAEMLGLPLGTVKSRLFYALRRLKEGMEGK